MSLVSVFYLFDHDEFQKKILPCLKDLYGGNYDTLRRLANELATENPGVWGLLNDLSYFPSDLGNENMSFSDLNSRITFWITLVICFYCTRIDGFVNSSNISSLGLVGSVSKDLTTGKPIRSLLHSITDFNETEEKKLYSNLRFRVGWLNIQDIKELINEIELYHRQDSNSGLDNLLKLLKKVVQSGREIILGATL